MVVETDGSTSLDENMRQTLLACYREFSDILKQMAITHVCIYVYTCIVHTYNVKGFVSTYII